MDITRIVILPTINLIYLYASEYSIPSNHVFLKFFPPLLSTVYILAKE